MVATGGRGGQAFMVLRNSSLIPDYPIGRRVVGAGARGLGRRQQHLEGDGGVGGREAFDGGVEFGRIGGRLDYDREAVLEEHLGQLNDLHHVAEATAHRWTLYSHDFMGGISLQVHCGIHAASAMADVS
ncbi:hypothetical protein ABZP36_026014 [Zizania latifolia]